jgi:uncharacterized damage-inducible protein DinB
MYTADVFAEAFERIRAEVLRAAADLDTDQLGHRPDAEANSIAWLVWHTSRVQDHHVSEIAGVDQAYVAGGFAAALGLRPDSSDIGYGHTSEEVAMIRPEDSLMLIEYHEAVTSRTLEYVAGIHAEELDRIIDDSYDPPVSVGVRLVSVINDNMQHVGQANYVRGLVERMRPHSN